MIKNARRRRSPVLHNANSIYYHFRRLSSGLCAVKGGVGICGSTAYTSRIFLRRRRRPCRKIRESKQFLRPLAASRSIINFLTKTCGTRNQISCTQQTEISQFESIEGNSDRNVVHMRAANNNSVEKVDRKLFRV